MNREHFEDRTAAPRFAGQVAVVTGAATGLGEAIAARLVSEGARVALLDRDAASLQRTTDALTAAGHTAFGFVTNVAEEASVKDAINRTHTELGRPQVLVHCAGIVGPTSTKIVDYPIEEFDRVYKVNLKGSFLLTKSVLPSMLEAAYGRILLIASIAGKEGNPGMCGYSATKAGLIGLVKGVAKEYATSGVTINALAPAVIVTDMVRNQSPEQVAYMTARIPMQRCGTLDEVAAMASWIVSTECSFSTGFTFDLSGGRATY